MRRRHVGNPALENARHPDRKNFAFQTVCVHPRLLYLLVDKEVTRQEFVLLLMVKALSRSGRGGKKKLCWATNKYFAQRIGTQPTHISRAIRSLVKKKLLRIVPGKRNGIQWRFLEALIGEEGESDRVTENGNDPLTENGNDPLTENGNQKKKEYEEERKGNGRRSRHTPLFSMNGESNNCYEWEKKLRHSLHQRTPAIPVGKGSRESWAKEFSTLWRSLGKDEKRINRVLNWYVDNIDHIERPTIANAKQFRDHFVWIEDLRTKDLKKKGESVDGTRIVKYKKLPNGVVRAYTVVEG